MRKTVAAIAVLVVGLTTGPAGALEREPKGHTAAKCTHTSWFHHDPPLTMEPSSGHMESAEPGVLECHGVIDGVAVSGKGTYTWKGVFGAGLVSEYTGGGNCFYGSGYGTFKGKVPTADGRQLHIRGEFNFVRGLHAGPEWGTINGAPYTGVLRGDTPDVVGRQCSEVPITRSNLYSDLVVGNASL